MIFRLSPVQSSPRTALSSNVSLRGSPLDWPAEIGSRYTSPPDRYGSLMNARVRPSGENLGK